MIAPRKLPTFEECWSKDMTKVQREVFLIVDEWWKEFGYSPSLRDIAYQRGKSSLANTMKIVNRLCDIGVLKKQEGRGRTIRPVYINFRTLE
jgi:SOS-response transcriptional repressor LexA